MECVVKMFKMPDHHLPEAGWLSLFLSLERLKTSIAWRANEDESIVKLIMEKIQDTMVVPGAELAVGIPTAVDFFLSF